MNPTQTPRLDQPEPLSRLESLATVHPAELPSSAQVTFRRFGHGAPLVLLHGGHGNWKHWAANIEALAAGHEVWVPDMPGYGDSDDPESNSDFRLLVDAMADALDSVFGATTAIDLAGFSFGGLVAATLASRRPVRRLALLGSAGHGSARREYGPMKNWRAAPTPEARREALRDNLAAFMLCDEASVDATAVAIYEDACVHTRFRSKGTSLGEGLAQTLAKVDAPTLLIWGDEDVTAAHPETFVDTLPPGLDYRFEKIAHAGHWVQWERAAEVNARLIDWFSQ